MEKAFTYMFKDNMFKNKMLAYFVLAFATNILLKLGAYYVNKPSMGSTSIVLLIFGIILGFPIFGYLISCMKGIIGQDDNIVLPFINLGKNFVQGFKFFISFILFYLMIIGFALAYMLIPLLFAFLKLQLIAIIFIFLLLILLIPLSIAILFYFPALFSIFAKTEGLTSLCRFGLATKLIKDNPSNYLVNILVYYLLSMVIAGIDAILGVLSVNISFIVIGTVITAVIAAYFVFVSAYLLAKAVNTNLIEVKTKEL